MTDHCRVKICLTFTMESSEYYRCYISSVFSQFWIYFLVLFWGFLGGRELQDFLGHAVKDNYSLAFLRLLLEKWICCWWENETMGSKCLAFAFFLSSSIIYLKCQWGFVVGWLVLVGFFVLEQRAPLFSSAALFHSHNRNPCFLFLLLKFSITLNSAINTLYVNAQEIQQNTRNHLLFFFASLVPNPGICSFWGRRGAIHG